MKLELVWREEDGAGLAGLLTAAPVERTVRRDDAGVRVAPPVGLRVPTWPAVHAGALGYTAQLHALAYRPPHHPGAVRRPVQGQCSDGGLTSS